VVAKFFFGRPLPGTITMVSSYYMIAVAFLPLAFTEMRNAHISVEILVEHFPNGAQRGLNVAAMLFGAVVFAMLGWQGFIEAERARISGAFVIEQDVKLLIWPARYLLPISALLMTVTLLAKTAIGIARGRDLNLNSSYF